MLRRNRHLLLLFFLTPIVAFSQKFSFKNYSIEHGLPQAYVYSLMQNRDGNMIVCTGKGNVNFNGMRFKISNAVTLAAEDFVTTSFIDNVGNCWYGCFSGAIYRQRDKYEEAKLVYQAKSSITHICETQSGYIVLSTRNSGLLRIQNVDQNKTEEYADCNQYLINSIESIGDEELILGTNEGLLIYSQNSHKIRPCNLLSNIEITVIKQKNDRTGFWIGTKEKGVFEISFDENLNLKLLRNVSFEEGLSSNNVQAITEDKSNGLWVSTLEGGINKVELKNNYHVLFFGNDYGLSTEFIKTMLLDNEGNLWLGTYGGGLFRLDIDPFELITTQNGLIDNNVTTLVSDTAGNFWFGTNYGISQINFKNEIIKNFTQEKGLPSNKITSLYFDEPTNKLWVGTADKGICAIDIVTEKINNFNYQPNLEGDYINSINGDKAGNIWVSTTLEGVFKFNGSFSQFSTKNGLGHNYIYYSYGDSKGRVWFATHAAALNYYENGKINEVKENLGFNSYDFNSFCEDKNGNIWTATFGSGFGNTTITPKKIITSEDGLFSNYCYGMIADKDGNLWVTQKNSLTKYNPIKQNIKTFSEKDLFGDNLFNINATNMDANGNIWLGTAKGAIKYLYSIFNTNKFEAKPSITDFKVFNESKKITDYLSLPYNKYSMSFEFTAQSFTKAEDVLFKYMLEGRDNDWSYATRNTSVAYANLEDGNYTFKLMACNNDGLWCKTPVTVSFTIYPPVWKTWWFWTILVAVLILLITYYVNLRARQLKQQRDELQRMVDDKTKELSNEKSVVESQNKIIRAKNKDIQDSINYAQKIQDAILPDVNELKKILTDIFILYQPREVVSGDFYWYTVVDDSIIIAAADCTGHGVPGALMSMIGNALLREIVLLNGIHVPHEILYALDEGIINTLNQGGAEKERKDGMAISICKIIPQKQLISFASSQQSLIHIGSNGAIEMKGEFFSIGDYEVTDKKFETHNFYYQKEDMIYLFSDGYLDQFGGNDNRKYMKKRFVDLLSQVAHLEAVFQKAALEKNMAEWKGEKNQTDDIMVIGIRL